jgi:PHD/YefM family antitoxin component YafN of YafNO toxin-antitoxin module
MLQNHVQKVVAGIALAVAAPVLLPVAKNVLQPLAVLGKKGAGNLVDRAKYAVQIAKEEVEDIVAEAQFERLKRQLDREILG